MYDLDFCTRQWESCQEIKQILHYLGQNDFYEYNKLLEDISGSLYQVVLKETSSKDQITIHTSIFCHDQLNTFTNWKNELTCT